MKKRKSTLTSIANLASAMVLKSLKIHVMIVLRSPVIQMKKQLSDLQTEYHEKLSKLENENDSLKESCRVLCNRCFTLTRGVTCLFCGLDYPCPHMPGLEEQVTMAHELRKEIEKNG